MFRELLNYIIEVYILAKPNIASKSFYFNVTNLIITGNLFLSKYQFFILSNLLINREL